MDRALYSSRRVDWGTPTKVYAPLHDEFGFTLDPCATGDNAKCELYYTPEIDGLAQPWAPHRVFMNPPYGKEIAQWMAKAVAEKTLVVALVPARTDTRWWHTYVLPHAAEVRFRLGRIRFEGGKSAAPFPSAIVVYRAPDAQ